MNVDGKATVMTNSDDGNCNSDKDRDCNSDRDSNNNGDSGIGGAVGLPVPELADSLKQFLEALEPIAEPEAFALTKERVRKFENGEGALLQKRLRQYARELGGESWLKEYSGRRFLAIREPLSITGNFTVRFVRPERLKQKTQAETAALLVHAVGRLYREIAEGNLEPPKGSCSTLSSEQLARALGAIRYPEKNLDRYEVFEPFREANSCGVFYRNHFYLLRLFDASGNLADLAAIQEAVCGILADRRPAESVSLCTSCFAGSDICSELLNDMLSDEENWQHYNDLCRTIFHLSLDERLLDDCSFPLLLFSDTSNLWLYKPWSFTAFADGGLAVNNEHTAIDGVSNVYLYERVFHYMEEEAELQKDRGDGFGTQRFSEQRVREQKVSGQCCGGQTGSQHSSGGHSWGGLNRDGQSSAETSVLAEPEVTVLAEPDVSVVSNEAKARAVPGTASADVRKLNFKINPEQKQRLERVRQRYLDRIEAFRFDSFACEGIDWHSYQEKGISRDALIQMGFLYAEYKMYGVFKSTHESVSTAHFHQGRTSCIRTATREGIAFVQALAETEAEILRDEALSSEVLRDGDLSAGALNGERVESDKKACLLSKLRAASDRHRRNVRLAKQNVCFIRHSAGLLDMYQRFGSELGLTEKPALFSDENYSRFCTQELSTSTVGSSPIAAAFGFAPTAADGLGLGYLTNETGFRTTIIWNGGEKSGGEAFAGYLEEYWEKVKAL